MNKNLRRLSLLRRMYDLSVFYLISVSAYGISFQGDFSKEVTKAAMKLKFSQKIDDNGYIVFQRGIYEITLT